jgi:hypothetical protein
LNLVVILLIFMQLDFERRHPRARQRRRIARSHNEFMVLIGATGVQTGLAVRTIANSLFGAAPHPEA